MKYLITNADDFGWGEDISRGIIDSHINGVLSSASVIINEIDNASLKLALKTPTLGLGLHLRPTTKKPGMTCMAHLIPSSFLKNLKNNITYFVNF